MESLEKRSLITKFFLIFLFLISFVLLHPLSQAASLTALFLSLFILFEGFGFKLITKIFLAIGFALGVSLFSLKTDYFPVEDLIQIKPVGSVIFMNCLTMALVPLVFSSILVGVTNLKDMAKLKRIGIKTFIYYMVTTAIAISIGLSLANMMKPGSDISPEIKERFTQSYASVAKQKVSDAEQTNQTAFDTFLSIFPQNIMESVSFKKPQMLQLIFFAIICGIALLQIESQWSNPVIRFFEGVMEMTIRIVSMIMRIAPYGVFSLITATVAQTKSIELLTTLIPFSFCVILGLLIHGLGVNYLLLKYLARVNPLHFFQSMKEVALTAFSTSSSGATIPVTLTETKTKMDVDNEIASFVIPLGATVNMDGTALFLGTSVIFLSFIYNIPLGMTDQLIVVIMAVLASIGTAAVPGVSIVLMTMILVTVNIPAEAILFILPVNNLLDMCRTTVNVIGDAACSVYVDRSEKRKKA